MNVTRRNKYARRQGIRWQQGLVLLIILVVIVSSGIWRGNDQSHAPEDLSEGTYQVRRVIDGDTLLLENGARVRLICANTPETVKPDHPVEPFGPEATRFTKDFLAGGNAYLTFDREKVDRYDRFLAYVWQDERMELMLNEELIREGLAQAKTGYRFSAQMKKRFSRAEDEAKAEKRGIWSGGNP
ncbi:MAG: thermonuclease family protein [Pirellulales bacterium]|nr:thermonuclease family protein [Pirellulales bacterium]